METLIKGQQVTSTTISKNCRDGHGKSLALEIALQEIREKYEFTLNAPVNEKATIRIVMTIDREI
ncbi:MAG: hypothetical protein IID03_12060 [Candidatus Dadabacteria bacterium]|nr:hypothetical protein [Candidatus Dadabacteria bacterium]